MVDNDASKVWLTYNYKTVEYWCLRNGCKVMYPFYFNLSCFFRDQEGQLVHLEQMEREGPKDHRVHVVQLDKEENEVDLEKQVNWWWLTWNKYLSLGSVCCILLLEMGNCDDQMLINVFSIL